MIAHFILHVFGYHTFIIDFDFIRQECIQQHIACQIHTSASLCTLSNGDGICSEAIYEIEFCYIKTACLNVSIKIPDLNDSFLPSVLYAFYGIFEYNGVY
jgi:hypothetical protein